MRLNGDFRRKEQQLYDSLRSAPVTVAELVVGVRMLEDALVD